MKKLLASIEKEMKRETNEVVELAMSEHKIEMWDAVLSGFQEALDRAKTKYHDKSASKFKLVFLRQSLDVSGIFQPIMLR